jgi:hypothetical protein
VEVENRLASPLADVDEDAVVLEPLLSRRRGDELEHPLGLVRREVADVVEARDMTLGEDEQMDVRLWVDISDRYEAVGLCDVLSLLVEAAEEAVFRQRRSLPP